MKWTNFNWFSSLVKFVQKDMVLCIDNVSIDGFCFLDGFLFCLPLLLSLYKTKPLFYGP